MHENREISSTPWSDDQGRSAKATSRTADMYVREKSDCVVLPVNQPNKGGQPFAEAGEGRAQTRENIAQSHMHPTQSGKRMSQGLDGVRKAAKERKQERFSALLHHLSVELLRDSFFALQRKASPGIDGVTWAEYETGLEDRLVDLHSRVHRGAYRAKPSRRVFIPKADGRQRPLGIAALEDKIIQQAVVTILNQIYEVDFKGFSYGFRPGRSPHQALDALTVVRIRLAHRCAQAPRLQSDSWIPWVRYSEHVHPGPNRTVLVESSTVNRGPIWPPVASWDISRISFGIHAS